jgi:hypothetical protein
LALWYPPPLSPSPSPEYAHFILHVKPQDIV